MEARLQALLDKQEITELVYAYCSASDRHDHDRLRTLYHPDATDDHGAFFQGLASEFIDQLPEIQAPMEILHQIGGTTDIPHRKYHFSLKPRPGKAFSGALSFDCSLNWLIF